MIRRILFSLALFISATFVGPVSVTLAGPVAVPALKPNASFSPATQTNNSYWYSLAGSASDSTYILNSSALKLWADRSGNSAVNGLVMNGVNGNYGSSPDSAALSITGDIDLRVFCQFISWTPASESALISKWLDAGLNNDYLLTLQSDGKLHLYVTQDGTTQISFISSVAVGFSEGSSNWIRAALDVDNGAAGKTTTFYTSSDGSTWTPLGTARTIAGTMTIHDGTGALNVGTYNNGTGFKSTGMFYRAQIYNGIAGTLAFDANFTTVAKLAASFTESSANAATVTINTSGDFGARISGARDLVQLTASHQPAFSTSAGYNQLTTDGTNDVMRSAPFAEAQPITDYTVASMVTWTSGAYLWDGASGANTAAAIMTTGTPQVNISAGSSVAANTNAVVGTLAVFTEFLSGASSSLQVNATTATTGNAGTGIPNGVTIGASGASTPANFSNIVIREKLGRTATDSSTLRTQIYTYLKAKNGVP